MPSSGPDRPGARSLARMLLAGTVLVWGATFVLVKAALVDASPFVFNVLRMLLATLVLSAVNRRALRSITPRQIRAGAWAGLFLAAGYQFQTLGLARTTPAKSAFLTGLVVVFVPALTLVPRLRPHGARPPGWGAAAGASLAFTGLLLLTTPSGTQVQHLFAAIGAGDLLTLLCAVAFAAHLLTLGRVSVGVSAGVLATLQIGFATLIMALTLPFEGSHTLHLTARLAVALVVTSVLATAAAFTIQSFAQQVLPPTQTAVILTLEPVFAALTSLLLFHEVLGLRAACGAALILLAIVILELLPARMHATEIPA